MDGTKDVWITVWCFTNLELSSDKFGLLVKGFIMAPICAVGLTAAEVNHRPGVLQYWWRENGWDSFVLFFFFGDGRHPDSYFRTRMAYLNHDRWTDTQRWLHFGEGCAGWSLLIAFLVPKLSRCSNSNNIISDINIINFEFWSADPWRNPTAVAATLLVGADQSCPEARKDKGQFRCKAEFAIPKCLALANFMADLMADLMAGWWLSPTPLKNDGVRQLGWWHSQEMEIYSKRSKPPTSHISSYNHHVIHFWHSQSMESHKIPWFQSPPTRCGICRIWIHKTWYPKDGCHPKTVYILKWQTTDTGIPPIVTFIWFKDKLISWYQLTL